VEISGRFLGGEKTLGGKSNWSNRIS